MPPERDEDELEAVREAGGDGDDLHRGDDADRVLLRRIGAAARSAGRDPVPPVEPPPEVWAGIAEALDLERPAPGDGSVVPLGPRRRRPPMAWIAAVAAAIVVVVGIGAVLVWPDRSGTVVASVELDPLGGPASGTAQLVDPGDGTLRIDLDVEEAAPAGSFLEVWLIDTEVTRLISLGPLSGDGRFVLPEGLDIATFPVVDVSVESFDGDPTHSGDSVLRGVLEV